MSSKPRKSMANIIQFLDRIEIDCLKNQEIIIAQAKQLIPFPNIIWEEPRWDVTSTFQHKARGHETRKGKYLNFYQNVPNNMLPLDGRFADIVKALTVLRFCTGGQGAPNQQRFIDGWRYIYEALEVFQYQIEFISPEILNSACRRASERLAQGTAYNTHKSIHEISDLLDKNKLTKVFLGFRYAGTKRPETTSGVGYTRLDDPQTLETASPKLADDNVLSSLGLLYQKIPRDALADRVRILLITLAIFLGRRIGEILTLPALPVQTNENGTSYIFVYPQKRAQGDLTITKERVPIPTRSLELIRTVVDELLKITASTRDVAEYIHRNNHADYRSLDPYSSKGWITYAELRKCIGVVDAVTWAKNRGVAAKPVPSIKYTKAHCMDLEHVKQGMNQDVDLKPVLFSNEGKVFLKDCLAILPINACHTRKNSFNYAVRLIDWQQVSDFLGSNSSRRLGKQPYQKQGKAISAFDRYLDPTEAKLLSVNSHAFRHTLNTWLDEGGMSDTAQTRWFGRKNPRDTKAYQHTSPAKAALQVRNDLLNGLISGPVTQQIQLLPMSMREAVIKARVRAVHDVGPGLCFHDFSQMPCERSLQCTASCNDFHWRADDKGRLEELKRQYAITALAREVSEERAKLGRGKSQDWLSHNEKKLMTIKQQLLEQGVSELNPHEYLENDQS